MTDKTSILNKLKEISNLESEFNTLNSTIIELNSVINNEEIDVGRIASIINRDPMLTTMVLKAANSSYYGLSRKVGTVQQAVSVLGLSNIQKFLTINVLKKNLKPNTEDNFWDDLWRHSLGTAISAQHIAGYVNSRMADILFTIGMLHDLGSFIVYQHLPEESNKIIATMKKDSNQRLLAVEKDVLGLTHQEIGTYFARAWNFPQLFVDSIRYHHFISDNVESKEYIAVVMIANNLAKGMELGKSINMYVEPIPNWVWAMVRIPETDFPKMVQQVRNTFLALEQIV